MQHYLNDIIKINGIYDILCSLCLFKMFHIPILCDLHLSMFIEPPKESFQILLAVWILTNGIIRLGENKNWIVSSYYLESLYFTVEYINERVYEEKALFVILSSFLLGYLCQKE
jgi:hypothetical protein